jgi:hypothetical protein
MTPRSRTDPGRTGFLAPLRGCLDDGDMKITVMEPDGFYDSVEVHTLRELDDLIGKQKSRGWRVDIRPEGEELVMVLSESTRAV